MITQDNTTLARIGQVAINAHDVDRATAFYRDVLGLRHLFRAGALSFLTSSSKLLSPRSSGGGLPSYTSAWRCCR